VRSYALELLGWIRFLDAVEVSWDRASRAEARDYALRLALEKAPAGAQLFAATEDGIPVREIAKVIGRRLGIPAESIPADQVPDHFRTFPFIDLTSRCRARKPSSCSAGTRPTRA
jgi:hypothetical protein